MISFQKAVMGLAHLNIKYSGALAHCSQTSANFEAFCSVRTANTVISAFS